MTNKQMKEHIRFAIVWALHFPFLTPLVFRSKNCDQLYATVYDKGPLINRDTKSKPWGRGRTSQISLRLYMYKRKMLFVWF